MLFARNDEKNQKLAAMSMKFFDVNLLSQVCHHLLVDVTPLMPPCPSMPESTTDAHNIITNVSSSVS